jgi:hypothetical protein
MHDTDAVHIPFAPDLASALCTYQMQSTNKHCYGFAVAVDRGAAVSVTAPACDRFVVFLGMLALVKPIGIAASLFQMYRLSYHHDVGSHIRIVVRLRYGAVFQCRLYGVARFRQVFE